MKLYHWTMPRNLASIAHSGLEPKPPYKETPYMTAGQSVVWLTANPKRDISAADAEYLRTMVPDWDRPILFGNADDIRLTVTFNSSTPSRRNLHRWSEWIAKRIMVDQVTGEEIPLSKLIECMPPSGEHDFWVCLTRIPVSQIELPPITARVAMLGLKEDSEPYKQLGALPPDQIVRVAA